MPSWVRAVIHPSQTVLKNCSKDTGYYWNSVIPIGHTGHFLFPVTVFRIHAFI